MDPSLKDEFRNETKGFVGVISIDNGKEKGIAVRPGHTVWLSEQEQVLTANAPRLDSDNPFTNGSLSLVTKAADVKNRRPIGDQAPPAEGAAAPEQVAPSDDAPEPPREEKPAEAGPEGNQEAPPTPPPTPRQQADAARVEAETKKAAAAQRQAKQGANPEAEPPGLTQAGVPKAPAEGTRAPTEEVGV